MITAFDLIVVTADEPYHGMSHTQILYTNFFAKQKTVLYVEPPHKWRPWNILNFFNPPAQQHSNLFVHTYVNALPSKLKLGTIVNERLNDAVIARFLKKRKAKNTLIWHFDSYRSVLNGAALRAQSKLQHIYHVIDPFYNNPVDTQLRAIAKVVVVTSPRNMPFYDNVKSKLLQVPQCVDLSYERSFIDKSISSAEKKYLVLLGTISDDIDFSLLLQIASAKLPLLLVGKIVPLRTKQHLYEQLLAISTVNYVGFLPPKDFYPLLQKASAGIIAYDLSLRSRSFSPLKALNYLIAGLPVISNCETELPELKINCIYETSDSNDFLSLCKRALSSNLSFDVAKLEHHLKEIDLQSAVTHILEEAN